MLAVVQNSQDWQDFQLQFLQQLSHVSIPLGPGFQCKPQSFPCLVDAFVVHGAPITCCFVYPPDAARLLLAAGLSPTTPIGPAAAPSILMTQPASAHTEAKAASGIADQDAFNRHISAMLLTIVDLMVTTGIVKSLDFERRLNEGQRLVDEIMTAKKDNLGIDRPLAESAEMVLRRLGFNLNEMDDLPKV